VFACNYGGLGDSKACIHISVGISLVLALGGLEQRLVDIIKVILPTEVGYEDGRWMELTLNCFCVSHVDIIKVTLPTEVGYEDGRWMELTLNCFCVSHVDIIKVILPTEVGYEDGRWMELTLNCFCVSHVSSVLLPERHELSIW